MSSALQLPESSPALLAAAWRALQGVSDVESIAHGPEGVVSFRARVRVTSTDQHLDWFEEGVSTFRGREFSATNALRFTRAEASLALAHLRRGSHAPVHLVHLHPHEDSLRSASPHLCGQDLYSLRLTLAPRQLTLHWHIESPSGPTRISALYSLHSMP